MKINRLLLLLMVFSLSSCESFNNPSESKSDVSIIQSETTSEESKSESRSESITESEEESEDNFERIFSDKYYKDIDLSTPTLLRNSLQTIMFSTHKRYVTYGDIRYQFKNSDRDPNKSGNLICFYSRDSVKSTWDNGNTYNREHVWPKANSGGLFSQDAMGGSSGQNSYAGAGSDLHHVRPEKPDVNSDRGNQLFGSYTPSDEVKGDCARICLYLYIHYSNEVKGTGNNRNLFVGGLRLENVFKSTTILKNWSKSDPVDELERNRNEFVYSLQGNRNPFIDYPELVDMCF